jgi:glycine betaine catabolism B
MELSEILYKEVVFILSRENKEEYKFGKINEEFIEQHVTDFNKHFYVCGPDFIVQEIVKTLKKMGVNAATVVFEK